MITGHYILSASFAFLLLLLNICSPARAQFIDLTLSIDSKLTARTEQPLSFGTLNAGSGQNFIDLGDANMGIFSITGLENQSLLVSLNLPKALHHENSAVDDNVPIHLSAGYGYSIANSENATDLRPSSHRIIVKESPGAGLWNTIYVFIYGSITIRNITDGVYANDIVLNVEYM